MYARRACFHGIRIGVSRREGDGGVGKVGGCVVVRRREWSRLPLGERREEGTQTKKAKNYIDRILMLLLHLFNLNNQISALYNANWVKWVSQK